MKKQLGLLLLVFTVAISLSGIVTAAPQTNINNQQVYASVTKIDSPGAISNQNINSPRATNAYKSNLDQSTKNSPSNTVTTGGATIS